MRKIWAIYWGFGKFPQYSSEKVPYFSRSEIDPDQSCEMNEYAYRYLGIEPAYRTKALRLMILLINFKQLGTKITNRERYSLYLNEFRENLATNLVCHISPELRSLRAICGLVSYNACWIDNFRASVISPTSSLVITSGGKNFTEEISSSQMLWQSMPLKYRLA